MSTPSGGHAVHLISSGREQPGKNVLAGPKQAKQKGQLNEPPPAVPVHPAHAHLHSHTDLDPRLALSGGGGGHHGPPPPPPPKVEAIGMIDAWTRMPPQYASQAASLDPTTFMSSSPAAYYHPPPVSPYGAAAAYASIGANETVHGSAAAGAPWSNGSDVASYFGYPPTSADFHHHHHTADPSMFGNGYPTAAGTYTSNFGYSPFPTPTHTAPGPAVSPQDYTGWAATTTTPHDLLERAHQKNPYGGGGVGATAGDYYSYDIIGAAPSMMTAGLNLGPPAAAAPAVPPITVNCDERVKSLGNRIENLSIAGGSDQHQHHMNESRQQDAVTDGDPRTAHQESTVVERHRNGESSTADSNEATEANNNNNNNDADGDDSGNGSAKTIANNENHAVSTTGEVSPPVAPTCSNPPAHHAQQVGSGEGAAADSTAVEETGTTKSSINWSNWNWTEEEVKDWSASPPPAAALPSGEEDDDVVVRTDDDDNHQLAFKDAIDTGGNGDLREQQEQTSAHLLQDLKRKNNYNPSELDLRVEGARFFVIKSYSEDDVHRSIKYSIWCSTEHGNKKLDQAFRHQKNLPIYLFYSVNGSGHFCGMAQMTSSVDYDTLTGVWAQDKWKGKFNVKWIYVKDIPNPELRHIRLENNENKPVTNSRDTQEIPPDKGRQVLEIMHKYRHETSLFDDFVYYEDMEHKREAERDLHDSGARSSAVAGAATSSSTFRNFPPKRKGDDSRDGYPSNGNHHHQHHHHHRDNHHHHHGKDYRDSRDHASRSSGRSFSGASYNRDNRGFGSGGGGGGGGGYRSNETGSPQPPPSQRSSNHVGRSFTTFRRDRDGGGGGGGTGNERTFFSNRYNTQLRNESAHWRS